MNSYSVPRTVGCCAVVLALAACADSSGNTRAGGSRGLSAGASLPSAGPSLPEGLTPLAAAQLDSGNVAYRLKQYAQALVYYEHASSSVPAHPAPWYGVYMVASAQGNTQLADSALNMVSARSGGGELLQQDVSVQHGQSGTSPSPSAGQTAATPHPTPMVSKHPVLGARN